MRKEGMHARLEHLDTEIFGMPAKDGRRPLHTLKTLDGSSQIFGLLLIKENTSKTVDYRLDGATPTVGDGRAAGGGEFQRSHAEILFAGEQQGTTAAGIMFYFGIRKPAEKTYGWASAGLQTIPIGPVTDDEQPSTQQIAGLHRKIDVFIGNQPRQNKLVVFLFF